MPLVQVIAGYTISAGEEPEVLASSWTGSRPPRAPAGVLALGADRLRETVPAP